MTTAALVSIQPAFTDSERFALAGFLAGYRGLTREACALDLRQFTSWCRARSLALFAVRRADIEGFARELEARGRARATVTRRLSAIAGFCKYAVEEELVDHSPAARVRRPRVDYESHAIALDRNGLGALLVAAGLGPPGEHALISLLALNGLRVSEATGADIGHLGLERGHRTLTITRKGGKVVTIAGTAHRPGERPGHRRAHGRSRGPGRGPATAGPARSRADRCESGSGGMRPGDRAEPADVCADVVPDLHERASCHQGTEARRTLILRSRYVRPLSHTAGMTFTTQMLTPETWDHFAALVEANNGVWVAAGAWDSTWRASVPATPGKETGRRSVGT
jgi:hypothetical protein